MNDDGDRENNLDSKTKWTVIAYVTSHKLAIHLPHLFHVAGRKDGGKVITTGMSEKPLKLCVLVENEISKNGFS